MDMKIHPTETLHIPNEMCYNQYRTNSHPIVLW